MNSSSLRAGYSGRPGCCRSWPDVFAASRYGGADRHRSTDAADTVDGMEVTTRHTPSFGVARLALAPNEPTRVEAGAMMAMSPGVVVQAKMEGGFLKSMKRAALGGESFFVTTYTAPQQGGFVDVASRLPGDLLSFEVTPQLPLVIQKGSWLASGHGVELDTHWGGFKNLFGSEGGFVLHASGAGPVVVGCYGALETWELAPGDRKSVV